MSYDVKSIFVKLIYNIVGEKNKNGKVQPDEFKHIVRTMKIEKTKTARKIQKARRESNKWMYEGTYGRENTEEQIRHAPAKLNGTALKISTCVCRLRTYVCQLAVFIPLYVCSVFTRPSHLSHHLLGTSICTTRAVECNFILAKAKCNLPCELLCAPWHVGAYENVI